MPLLCLCPGRQHGSGWVHPTVHSCPSPLTCPGALAGSVPTAEGISHSLRTRVSAVALGCQSHLSIRTASSSSQAAGLHPLFCGDFYAHEYNFILSGKYWPWFLTVLSLLYDTLLPSLVG